MKPLPDSEEQPPPLSPLQCAKVARQVGQILPLQVTAFNPIGSAELSAGTAAFHHCEPGENETYLHAEVCPGEYTAFIHQARRTLLLLWSLHFLLFCSRQRKTI